jgi:regulatory protein YycH of two-component signal transduction system YycFG
LTSENAPKGLEKAFEKLKNLLGQVQDKASKPLTGAGFKSVKLDLDKVQEGLSSINRLVGDFSDLADDVKITFLSDDEKRKVEEATKAMEKYLQLVVAANAKEKDLKSANKTKEKQKYAWKGQRIQLLLSKPRKQKKKLLLREKRARLPPYREWTRLIPKKLQDYRETLPNLR